MRKHIELTNPLTSESINEIEKIDNSKILNYRNVQNLIKNSNQTQSQLIENQENQENNKNVDLNHTFIPSQDTLKEIVEKFYSKTVNKLNKSNATNFTYKINNTIKNKTNTTSKNTQTLPALRSGGYVKTPTVAYLHENEAVVPLDKSKEFSNFLTDIKTEDTNSTKNFTSDIKNIEANNLNTKDSVSKNVENSKFKNMIELLNNETISSNESIEEIQNKKSVNSMIKNVTDKNLLKTYESQFSTNSMEKMMENILKAIAKTQQPQRSNENYSSKAEMKPSLSMPDTTQGQNSIGSAYGGSGSMNDFFNKSFKIPEWRTKLG